MEVPSDNRDLLQLYLDEIASATPLSSQEEVLLASRIRQGDMRARARLVEANLRFVIRVAREYRNYRVGMEDLVSAGNIGLINAAERFDETRGVKFISYAVWWIRQAIRQTLKDHGRTVRLPVNRQDLLKRIHRYIATRQQESTDSPTDEEIADAIGVSVDEVFDTLASGQHILSLDATIGGNSDSSLLDILEDDDQESPDALMMRNSLKDVIDLALEALSEQDRNVIRQYFGLDGQTRLTLEQIGVQLGVTRERVRQIKEKALRKLRRPFRARRLVHYAEEI